MCGNKNSIINSILNNDNTQQKTQKQNNKSLITLLFAKTPDDFRKKWNRKYFDQLLFSYYGPKGYRPNTVIRQSSEDKYLDPILIRLRRDLINDLDEELNPFSEYEKSKLIEEWMKRLEEYVENRWQDSPFKTYQSVGIPKTQLLTPKSPQTQNLFQKLEENNNNWNEINQKLKQHKQMIESSTSSEGTKQKNLSSINISNSQIKPDHIILSQPVSILDSGQTTPFRAKGEIHL